MVDLSDHVEADEVPLLELFTGDNTYQVPEFQRPFTWDEQNFEELVDDIVSAFTKEVPNWNQESGVVRDEGDELPYIPDEQEPYFLGSLILKESEDEEDAKFDIIDGQQRITSLSILIAVLRDMMNEEWNRIVGENWSDTLQEYIYVPGSMTGGTRETIRLHVRPRDRQFYEDNILQQGETLNDRDLDDPRLSDSQQRMLMATNVFEEYLDEWVNEKNGDPTLLVPFITLRTAMVKIETYSLQSAFRLFNVTNARGTPLTSADLLKSRNLRDVDESEREHYGGLWEEMEEGLTNEGLGDLIGIMRHIKRKDTNRSTVHEEFKNKIFDENPDYRGKTFIDELHDLYESYCARIQDKDIDSDPEQNTRFKNIISLMKSVYPSNEWRLPLLLFDLKFNGDSIEDEICKLMMKIEKLFSVGWFTTDSPRDRYSIAYDLLEEIEEADTPEEVLESPILNTRNKEDAERMWESLQATNFYRKGNYNWAKYLFLRIELARSEAPTVHKEFADNISIEHILPKSVEEDYWRDRFENEEFRNTWTDRFGNLVPLQDRKNRRASNRPFNEKLEEYFKKKSDLDLVNDLDEYEEWNRSNLKGRQQNLKEEAINVWFEEVPEEAVSD